ncbi:MAG: ABC transporter permease [Deltaproteobacteria bacterium]|nr:MAG: ABC transporter permease [Deltaproteobacteria bacterium]
MKRPILRERYHRLLLMVKDRWGRLLIAVLCMLVMAGTEAGIPFLMKPVIDDIFIKQDLDMLKLIPLVVVLLYVVKGFAMYGQEYLMNYVGEDIIRRLRNQLYARIQDLSLAFFHREKTGTLMSRITNDVHIIKTMVSTSVTGSVRDVFSIIGLTGVIFYRDWKLALLAMVVLPIAFYPVVEFGRRIRKVSTGRQEAMAEMNSFLHETLSGNKIVKAFGMEAYEKERLNHKSRRLFKFEMKSVKYRALTTPVMEFVGGLGGAGVIWYGGYKVITGASTPGTFFSFLAAVILLYGPAKKLAKLNTRVQEGMAAADRVFDIIEMEPDIVEPDVPRELKAGNHSVNFKDVHFKYEEDMVLKGINLNVAAGEILALVGMSGGGKTSLVNLIPRFYDVTRGAVHIDGIDIRDVAVSDLRKQVAIVTQEPILFNDTVRNNISYGSPDASKAAVEKAAKAAYAFDFIQRFTEGFETVIGELGSRLSGGEKQRICIARALLKDAPILILDEATSALDAESEKLVQKALENLMKGRTTFVIAHRLSTVGIAHRIIVLKGGEIVEQGSRDELLARRGTFFKLYQMQFSLDTADVDHEPQ